MSIQEILLWYQNFISTDLYLLFSIVIIIYSFFTRKICAAFMRPKLPKDKYGDMIELLEDDKNELYEAWEEAYAYLSKANTYICLAIFLTIQFIFVLFSPERDGIVTTVLMFTTAVSIMEARDNNTEYKKREKHLINRQAKLMTQADEIKDIGTQDTILNELEKNGIIDKEKRKEIINFLKR